MPHDKKRKREEAAKAAAAEAPDGSPAQVAACKSEFPVSHYVLSHKARAALYSDTSRRC